MILLDTDMLTLVQRRGGEEYARLVFRLDQAQDQDVRVTIVSFEEQMRGWLAWIVKARAGERLIDAYARLRGLLEDFGARPVVDFEERSYDEFARLSRMKTRVGTMDLRIAAIALANDALLLSRNLRDFSRVPGLRVEDWTVR